jgi:CRP-like cAMP-binding protein
MNETQVGRPPTLLGDERNRLISSLPVEEQQRVHAELEEVSFNFRDMVHEQDRPLEYALFPFGGVFSMVRQPEHENGMTVEFASVGKEGMVGLPLLLGGEAMSSMCFCQVAGSAARIPAAAFKRLLETCPALYRLLLRYTQALLTQIAQGAACNRMHPIEERCARWLLMTQDRVGADHFILSQDFLAQMLGVRRPSVTVAANMLRKAGLIRYVRGLVVIADRAGLEAASCECYRIITSEFERLVG